MKRVSLLWLICFLSINVHAQWTLKATIDTSLSYCINFSSPDTGYIGAINSETFKTVDGGATWLRQNLGGSDLFYNIRFTTNNIGFLCGYNNLLKTTDGGINWIPQSIGTTSQIADIFFTTPTTGYATLIDSSVQKTTNSGNNWTPTLTNLTGGVGQIFFPNQDTGYIAGYGKLYRTYTSGTNWTALNSFTTKSIFSMFFPNTHIGYAVGDSGLIIKTTDFGNSWSVLNSGTINTLTTIAFINSDTGFAVGRHGTLLQTIDGGLNWSSIPTDPNYILWDLQFVNHNIGYIVGSYETGYYTSKSKVFKTSDGGVTWIGEIPGNSNSVIISPNPFTQSTQITLPQTYRSITLEVYNVQGQQVAQYQYADCDKIQLLRNHLGSGLYFLKLTGDDGEVRTGKVVVSE